MRCLPENVECSYVFILLLSLLHHAIYPRIFSGVLYVDAVWYEYFTFSENIPIFLENVVHVFI